MARVLVSGHGESLLLERLRDSLGEDWIVLDGPHLDEIGPVDAIALHERQGAAIVIAQGPGEHPSPSGAVQSLRRMLDEHGITRALGGHLPIVALGMESTRARDPAGAIRGAFLAEPPIGVRIGWTPRIAALFEAVPAVPEQRSAAEALTLRADREDAWRVSRETKAASPPGLEVRADEQVVPTETVSEGGVLLWTGMVLAMLVVGGVLAGMAVLSYGNGPPGPQQVSTQPR